MVTLDLAIIAFVFAGVGFALGASWMWRVVNRAFDEYERDR